MIRKWLSESRYSFQEMERLDPSRCPSNPALVKQLQSQVLADVDKLELQLRRRLDDEDSGQVRSGDAKTVPQGAEESVAESSRRLSGTPVEGGCVFSGAGFGLWVLNSSTA